MTTTNHYWVSIGRNRKGTTTPLDSGDWDEFQDSIRRSAALWGTCTGVEVHGHSTWEGTGPEETFLLLLEIREDSVDGLRSSLARTADWYDQEAIGLVGGPGETLVQADPTLWA